MGEAGLSAVRHRGDLRDSAADDTTVVANWLGVDRGADLLTYALAIAFVFTTLSTYLRFKGLEPLRAVGPHGRSSSAHRCRITEAVSPVRESSKYGRADVRCPVVLPVALAAVGLIGLQLAVRAVLAFGGYFYWDDLIIIGRAEHSHCCPWRTCSPTTTGMPAAFLLGRAIPDGAAGGSGRGEPAGALALAALALLRTFYVLGWRPVLLLPLALPCSPR